MLSTEGSPVRGDRLSSEERALLKAGGGGVPWGLGSRVVGFRVWSLRLGFGVLGLGLGFRVWVLGF